MRFVAPRPASGGMALALATTAALSVSAGDPPRGAAEFAFVSSSGDWSAPVELSTPATGGARGLEIDANALGDFTAAWVVDAEDDIVAVIKTAGSSPGAPQIFAGDYDDPDVAIGGNSVGVLAWESNTSDETVYAASKAGSASAFSSPAEFEGDGHTSPSAPPSAQDPIVAVNEQGTGMLLFERDYYTPPSYSTLAEAIEGRVLVDPAANTWSAGADLHANPREPRNTEVSVAADGSVFLGSNGFELGPCYYIHAMVMENDGTGSGGGPIRYTCGGQLNGILPSNDRLPNGDVLMTYHHHTGGGVYALDISKGRALSGSTDLSSQEVRLDDPDGSEDGVWPRVRTDAAGNAVVVWHDTTGTDSMLARFRPAGQTTWGPVEVISSGETYQGDFSFDLDAAGNGYLVYERTDGVNQQVVAAERSPGAAGVWTTPVVLSTDQGIVASPMVVAAADGHAFAAWIANSGDQVYLSSFAPSNPAGPGGPGNPGDGDHTAPRLRVDGAKKQTNKKRVVINASCDEICTVTAGLKGKARIKKGPPGTKKNVKLTLKETATTLAAGRSQPLALKFKGSKTKKLVRRVLGSKRGKIKLVLSITAVDQAGNTSQDTFKVVLRRG